MDLNNNFDINEQMSEQSQYISYAELKGYCMDSEQELYSTLLERFSLKF